jgi:uncharacterized protein (TIGR02996 family)
MSEREALYRAVCERPDDDLPRLVFADWLDEHGEHDRATFIRVQCELEALSPASPEAARLLAAHHGLLKRTDWGERELLPAGCGWPGADRSPYRRGFRWQVSALSVGSFLGAADDVFRAAPVTGLSLTDTHPMNLPLLVRSPHLSRLTALDVQWTQLSRRGYRESDPTGPVSALGKSPFATNLIEMTLGPGEWSHRALETLAGTPLLARLRRLRVEFSGFRPARLAGADRLTRLAVNTRDLWTRAATDIPGEVAGRIESLTVGRFHDPAAAVRALAASGPFPRLESLTLSADVLTGADVGRLADDRTFPAVRAVSLPGCRLGRDTFAELLAAPFAPHLTLLDVTGNRLGDAGADLLCRADLPALEYLGVSPAGLSAEAVEKLRDRFGGRLVVADG